MASSSARRHLFLVASLVAALAAAAPRAADAWGGGRFFFSKTARDEAAAAAAVEPQKAANSAADPNAAPAFSRPSVGGSGRGYGLYGRPDESYPPDYFRRGVHRNAEKLTTTGEVPATGAEAEGARGRGERVQPFPEDVPATTGAQDAAVPVAGAGDLEGVRPYPEDGSGRGRPPWYYTAFRGGRQRQQEQRQEYGMSDTRLYQNGRYYYDVEAGRYGYGRASNPMRTRPDEEGMGSGYGRPRGAGDRRGYATGYQQYGNDDSEFGNGGMEQNQNGRYIP